MHLMTMIPSQRLIICRAIHTYKKIGSPLSTGPWPGSALSSKCSGSGVYVCVYKGELRNSGVHKGKPSKIQASMKDKTCLFSRILMRVHQN